METMGAHEEGCVAKAGGVRACGDFNVRRGGV